MSGIEMISEMKARELLSSIPVVIISTERSRERIEALMAMGVKAYLPKPFVPEEFATLVKELLN